MHDIIGRTGTSEPGQPVSSRPTDDVGWNVTETAMRLSYERGTLSRLLTGKAGVSANMALAL